MIQIVAQFDANAQKALIGFNLKKLAIFFGILISVFAVLGIVMYIYGGSDSPAFLMWGLAGFSLLIVIILPISAANTAKNNPLLRLGIINYNSFDNSFFYAKSTSQIGYEAVSTIPGNILLRAVETKDHFFIYQNTAVCNIIPKKDFVSGTPDELRAILQSWLPGNKYKRYGKNS